MCGIVGTYGLADEKLIKSMADSLSHRGPDGDGFYLGKNGGIGSRRLAIIDVEGGAMPISNEDATLWIVYNGEIYNYRGLTEVLKSKGHVFKTKSDTEMALHAYEEWGETCVTRFNGMFAFAIYDTKHDSVYVARDHFGIKPFYYVQLENYFLFSSEIKAFLKCESFVPRVNERSVYRYLAFRKHDDLSETFFDGVKRLLPGEYGLFSNHGLRVHKYFEPTFNHVLVRKEDEYINEFRKLFVKSVKDRLLSEVPVGSCLSGGLDSSAIVCLINYLLKKNELGTFELSALSSKQKVFSAVFPKEINNEEFYIREVLKSATVDDNFVYPKAFDLFSELEGFIYQQEEPFISSGPYAQWCVMREARKKVKVLLDGQGSDEIMAGYAPYILVYLRQLWFSGHYLLFFKELVFSIPQIKGVVYDFILRKLRRVMDSKELVGKAFAKGFEGEQPFVEKKNLKKRLYEDLFYDSIPALLRYEDKNSMAFSIEGRVPFLDPDLVSFVFSLPENMIIRNGMGKYILRKALEDILPKAILRRKWKVGFTTPEVAWFRQNKEEVYKIISSETFKNRKYFDYQNVIKFVADFYADKHNESMVIWRLLNLEVWLRVLIDHAGDNKINN